MVGSQTVNLLDGQPKGEQFKFPSGLNLFWYSAPSVPLPS